MRIFVLTIATLFSLRSYAQTEGEIPRRLLQICDSLAADSIIYGKEVGRFGGISKQWLLMDSLKRTYSDSAFYLLTENKSPIVRGLAFNVLREKNTTLFIIALVNHVNDTVIVRHQDGCIEQGSSLIDLIVRQTLRPWDSKNNPPIKLHPDEKVLLENLDAIAMERKYRQAKRRGKK